MPELGVIIRELRLHLEVELIEGDTGTNKARVTNPSFDHESGVYYRDIRVVFGKSSKSVGLSLGPGQSIETDIGAYAGPIHVTARADSFVLTTDPTKM